MTTYPRVRLRIQIALVPLTQDDKEYGAPIQLEERTDLKDLTFRQMSEIFIRFNELYDAVQNGK